MAADLGHPVARADLVGADQRVVGRQGFVEHVAEHRGVPLTRERRLTQGGAQVVAGAGRHELVHELLAAIGPAVAVDERHLGQSARPQLVDSPCNFIEEKDLGP